MQHLTRIIVNFYDKDDKQTQGKPSKTLWIKIKAIKEKLFKKFDGSNKIRPLYSINEIKA
jgi:hypothetical protein